MTAEEQEALFRGWIADHAGLMWRVVRACAATPEDQEDLLQEISLQLWTSLPAFRGASKESTWIYRVAFNTALVWRRGEKRRRTKHEAFLQRTVPVEATSHPDQISPDDELVARLYGAIRELPKLDASLILMHLDGLTYREISEVLGISENHVGVKLHRLRNQLADQLKGNEHELR